MLFSPVGWKYNYSEFLLTSRKNRNWCLHESNNYKLVWARHSVRYVHVLCDLLFTTLGRDGNGCPLQYSCLENSTDRGAWQVTVHGLQRIRQDWITFTFHFLEPNLRNLAQQAQHSENEDHGIWSHHLMGNRWGNNGNSVRLYFSGLQNHCRWWLQPWN